MTFFESATYSLARIGLQRGIGLVLLIAFLNAVNQFRPLLGDHGLLPVSFFVKQVPFRESPSLFYLLPHDVAFITAAWIGVFLSCLAVTGLSERFTPWISMIVWAMLWTLYISFVNVGQDFYAFGWESILLEACFYAVFLGSRSTTPQTAVIWLFRWLLFRVMFGAGLIKLRGDPCWRDLKCLNYYYETQPLPNPLSWYFHVAPAWTHSAGVVFNHFAELIVPFGYFLPQPISSIAGLITIAFQGTIFLSGNLSWLNFLTMILAISTFDDRRLSLLRLTFPRDRALGPDPSRRYYRARHPGRLSQHPADTQYAFAAPGDEHRLQPSAPGRHLRRIRIHHPPALRGHRRRHGRSGPDAIHEMARIRV